MAERSGISTSVQYNRLPTNRRVGRHPRHSYNIRYRPYQIVPMMIAPVLPGESMTNALWQALCQTDMPANSQVGWWKEEWLFYVKLRDLNDREALETMVINPSFDRTALNDDTARTYSYHFGKGAGASDSGYIDWTSKCLQRVVECYFREGDEAWNIATLDSLPIAGIPQETAIDSLMLDTEFTTDDIELLDISAGTTWIGSDDKLKMSELQAAMQQWAILQAGGLSEATFEDYLAQFGVKLPGEELHRPECIRYHKSWQLPMGSGGQGATAAAAAATTPITDSGRVKWRTALRADKKRFFKEPGFIFGVVCVRPKTYLQKQTGAIAHSMVDAFSWLPRIMDTDPIYSVRKFAAGCGPFQASNADYRLDIRDLLIYGDQFINYDISSFSAGGAPYMALPVTNTLQKRFPFTGAVSGAQTEIDQLFIDYTNAVIPGEKLIREDGVVALHIQGMQRDTTLRGQATAIT